MTWSDSSWRFVCGDVLLIVHIYAYYSLLGFEQKHLAVSWVAVKKKYSCSDKSQTCCFHRELSVAHLSCLALLLFKESLQLPVYSLESFPAPRGFGLESICSSLNICGFRQQTKNTEITNSYKKHDKKQCCNNWRGCQFWLCAIYDIVGTKSRKKMLWNVS